MAKVKRVARCFHCGAILQDTDPNMKGYCPEELLTNQSRVEDSVLYCQTCFDMFKDINSGELNHNIDEDIMHILDDAVATDAMVVWVVDTFTFNGTLKKSVVSKIKNLRVAVIATKKDLLAKYTTEKHLEKYVRYCFLEAGIDPVYVKAVGGKEEKQYAEILDTCIRNSEGRDVFVIGYTGAGKSTLLNRILKVYKNPTRRSVRVRNYPKTNIEVFTIPLSNSSNMYDLPGFDLDISVVGKVENDVKKCIVPKKSASMHRFTVDLGESIVLGGLAAYSVVKGRPSKYSIFVSEKVDVKKIKYENLDAFLLKNNDTKANKPTSKRFMSFHDYEVFEYAMERDGLLHDIAVEGLGWISFKGEGQTIRITIPKGVAIKETLAKVKK